MAQTEYLQAPEHNEWRACVIAALKLLGVSQRTFSAESAPLVGSDDVRWATRELERRNVTVSAARRVIDGVLRFQISRRNDDPNVLSQLAKYKPHDAPRWVPFTRRKEALADVTWIIGLRRLDLSEMSAIVAIVDRLLLVADPHLSRKSASELRIKFTNYFASLALLKSSNDYFLELHEAMTLLESGKCVNAWTLGHADILVQKKLESVNIRRKRRSVTSTTTDED